MPKDIKQIRDEINTLTRWVAYKVYSKYSGSVKFAKAYDRLAGRTYLDHDISLSKPTGSNESSFGSMFDQLSIDDMRLVLNSARNLQKMYSNSFDEKMA